jgi:hypothetical protein
MLDKKNNGAVMTEVVWPIIWPNDQAAVSSHSS